MKILKRGFTIKDTSISKKQVKETKAEKKLRNALLARLSVLKLAMDTYEAKSQVTV